MFLQIKEWFLDSNTRNFIIGFVSICLVYYISRGEDHNEKIHRLFKSVLVVIFVVVVFALLYGFSK